MSAEIEDRDSTAGGRRPTESREADFWSEMDRYHDLAKQFEQNIEITHPRGKFECKLNDIAGHCPFCVTGVKRYEYRGPKV